MSAPDDEIVGQLDLAMVSEMLGEPMYISELARRMQKLNLPLGYSNKEIQEVETIQRTWGDLTHGTALTASMISISLLTRAGDSDYEVFEQGYDGVDGVGRGKSQYTSSPIESVTEEGVVEEWQEYSIVHNPKVEQGDVGDSLTNVGYGELGSDMMEEVDATLTVDEKSEIIKELSRTGNDVSKDAEAIMQDVFSRQFKHYDKVRFSGYNDPGADFIVADEDRRNYGLVIEVSTRWVNPIGEPYISNKIMSALELEEDEISNQPWDVVILAPKFRKKSLQKHENPIDPNWHDDPDEGMVHLHHIPDLNPGVYRPFAKKPEEANDDGLGERGNPIIVPDGDKLQERARRTGKIAGRYPIVDDRYEKFIENLEYVFRDHMIITESRYRNMLRESIEPLLWEFMRPYKIEQFLIDTYWDKGLNQSEIGTLIDRSGSTIGTWMRDWGIMRRGTGAPELSDDTKEIWRRMYEGESPFPQQFSGYRIQAEYNRHPMWDLSDWGEWYSNTSEDERQESTRLQESFRENLDYTVMVGATQRLTPSYSFILSTLKEVGADVREPDEAPRVPYSAYPSQDALEYMINKNEKTTVDVSEE